MSPLNLGRTHKYTRYASAAICTGKLITNFECKSCTGINGRFLKSFKSTTLSSSGYIAVDESDKRILLVFRGASDITNTINNALLLPSPMLDTPSGSLVHTGFKIAMESLAPEFLATIEALISHSRYAAYKVAVIGHSLGGAVASLATVRLHHTLGIPWEEMELYTYGQPRTGNLVFARWLSQQPMGSSRVVHRNDIIPHLAPGLLDIYTHHQNEVWLGEGTAVTFCKTQVLEDPSCSNSVPLAELSQSDHLSYFNITLGNQAC
ncbi:hypothetical protein DSO57_1002100 [Entomophthora muscae]|uniref:Uncharacterized protein n=1 Tax=Entomophthora muscae TaxID=34485 RepID=A0ACC2TVS7_9FUNG|nr:hypothetical protein DSO57_1002100 [Entomophthora muscae]